MLSFTAVSPVMASEAAIQQETPVVTEGGQLQSLAAPSAVFAT
jgi:hypothetical protein